MKPEEREWWENVVRQIRGMQEDIKESEIRLEENRKVELE